MSKIRSLSRVLSRLYKLLVANSFRISMLSIMVLLLGIAVMAPAARSWGMGVPSMDIWSIRKWWYLLGLPFSPLYLGLCAVGSLYWISFLLKAVPQLKQRVSFAHTTLEEEMLPDAYARHECTLRHDLEYAAHHIRKVLLRKGFYVQERQKGSHIYFTAEKHRINLWSSMIAHGGMLCLLVGMSLWGWYGEREDIVVSEGIDNRLMYEPLSFAFINETQELYPGTSQVFRYTASVAVTEIDASLPQTHELSMSSPLWYDGLRYHVIDHGSSLKDAMVEIRPQRSVRQKTRLLRLTFGKDAPMLETPFKVRLEKFTPDFVVIDGDVTSRSRGSWVNPAIKIAIYQGPRRIFSKWLFQKYDSDDAYEQKEDLLVKLVRLNAGKYVSLRITRPRGLFWIWAGLLFIIAGVCIKYFYNYRILWILVESHDTTSRIVIAGQSTPDAVHFPAYFLRVAKALETCPR
jgi:cytochrome c biogenesis protein ResB